MQLDDVVITDDDTTVWTATDIVTNAIRWSRRCKCSFADIDGDGDLDIISASIHDDTISLV